MNDFYSEGGAEKVCQQIEELIKKQGGDVLFFYGSERHKNPRSPLGYIYSLKYANEMREKIRFFKPDIIHIHNYYHLLSPSILHEIRKCRKKGYFNGKVILTAHDYHLLCPNSGFLYYKQNKIVSHEALPTFRDILTKRYDRRGWAYSLLKKIQWIFNYSLLGVQDQINVVLAPSHFLKEKYSQKFPGKKNQVIRNPYDFNIETSARTDKNDSGVLELVFLGRVSPEKGLKEFVHSLSQINFERYHLDIIGDGPDLVNIEKLIMQLDLSDKIELVGRIPYEEVIQKMTQYDALVLPSLWVENAPLVIIEAVIAQIRLLTSNWGGVKELAELCGGNYLMNPSEMKSVHASLKSLYTDVCENKLLERDINKIKKEFSEEIFLQKITKIYSGKLA